MSARPFIYAALALGAGQLAVHAITWTGTELPPWVLVTAFCASLLVALPAVLTHPAASPTRGGGKRLPLRALFAHAPRWLSALLVVLAPYLVYLGLQVHGTVQLLRPVSTEWQRLLTLFFAWLTLFGAGALHR